MSFNESVISLSDSGGTTRPLIHTSPDMSTSSSDEEYFLEEISPNKTILRREATNNKIQCPTSPTTNTTTSAGIIGTLIEKQQQLDDNTHIKQQQNSSNMVTAANSTVSNINQTNYKNNQQTANSRKQQQKLSNMAATVGTSVGNTKPECSKNNYQAAITKPQLHKPTPNLAPISAPTQTKASNITKRSLMPTIENIQVTEPVASKLPTKITPLIDDWIADNKNYTGLPNVSPPSIQNLLTPSKRKRVELDSSDDLFESIKTPAFKSDAAKSIQQARRNSQSLSESQQNTQQHLQSFNNHQNKNKLDSDRNVGEIPPLFVPNVDAIIPLLEKLKNTPGIGSFVTKCASNGVRILSSCLSTYNAILNTLNEAGTHLYSHQLRKDRGLRVVIRHLHHTTPTEWISAKLAELSYKTRFIKAIKNNFTNKPYNLFEVEIEPKTDGSHLKILQLQALGLQVVKVERQAKPTDPAQCHRCQVFGHTKNYCHRPFVCMKCAGCHPTTTCQKRREEPSKCANCKGSHISSYKGCPSFKEARSKLLHSRQMHQAKINNLQNHMQQHQQAARSHQMPSPPATWGQPAGSMHTIASAPESNNRPTYSAALRSPVQETAPLSPVPGRTNKQQQPVQHNLQKKAISKVMTPANNTQQTSEQRQHQHQHRQHQQFQHPRQQADEQSQQQQSSNASPCEILLALQRSVEISKVLEEKVNNLSKTVYSILISLMRERNGSAVENHS